MIVFLCGDVMLGRGIDQILRYKSDPDLYEAYVTNAKYYVPVAMKQFATENNSVSDVYVWGELIKEKLFLDSKLKIINLETSITRSLTPYANKPVLYKMNPKNIGVIASAGIDYCHTANNHVMDWGLVGLIETIHTLKQAGIGFGGIGLDIAEASAPRISYSDGMRILIFSFGDVDSGIPTDWVATKSDPGVNLISTLNPDTKYKVVTHISKFSKPDDFIIVSIHWGSNWGYDVEVSHESFAHYLIDHAKVRIIHGHSSHHFRPIEIYSGRLIIYGCGDLINDYETIDNTEHKKFLPEVSMAYFPQYDKHTLTGLTIVPYICRNMQLVTVDESKTNEIVRVLNTICKKYNISFVSDQSYIKWVQAESYYARYIKYKNKYLNLYNANS